MSALRRFALRLYHLLRPDVGDGEAARELRAHLQVLEDEYRHRGYAPEDANREARRMLGGVTQALEQHREARTFQCVNEWIDDAWHGLRTLRRSPGFFVTALLTLGVAIGLSIGVFTVFNAVALRPWDVRDPDDVVVLFARPVGNLGVTHWLPAAEYEYLRGRVRGLRGLVAHSTRADLRSADGVPIETYGVSANFFDVLGVPMAAGRSFQPSDEHPSAPAAAIVSHAFWERHLGADPAVVGGAISCTPAVTCTIVGITDRSFNQFGRSGDLFIPLQLALGNEPPAQADSTVRRVVTIAGRLTPGVTRQRAQAEVDTLSRQFRISASLDGNGLVLGSTRRLFQPDDLPGAWLPTFGGLGAAAFLILLLACANVGNLQIARSLARRREILVRLSLGAGRARVVRLLLAEASWLTIAATAMGLSCSQLVLAFVPLDSTITAGRLAPTAPVVGFSIGIAALSVLLFALAPALRATDGRSSLVTTRGTGLDPRGRTLRSFLLATQLALSLTLLVSAALLSRGMAHIRHVELGFDSARTAIARLTLPDGRRTPEAADAFISALDPILRSSQLWPAGWTNEPPLTGARLGAWVRRPHEMDSRRRRVQRRSMSPSAFAALGLTFVSGRPYDDRSGGVVINETLARTIWPDAGAVGQSLSIRNVHGEETTQTVAGVVRDSRLTTPAAVEPLVLEPAQGTFGCCPILVFRASTTGAPAALRALIERVDPGVRITTASVVDAGIQEGLEAQRLAATIAWGIGALGLGLATIGVFGVFAQAVEERRSEIAIRLALGAAPRNIVAVMFRANRAPVGGGLAAGLFLSVSAGIAIRAYLFGLSPLDPPSYAVVVGILSATAAIATFIPLRRALRIAPGVALRSE